MCIIAMAMSMHAMITAMALVNYDAMFVLALIGGCRGLLVPPPHGGSVGTPEPSGAARGVETVPRRASSIGAAAEGMGGAGKKGRTRAFACGGGSGDRGGSISDYD